MSQKKRNYCSYFILCLNIHRLLFKSWLCSLPWKQLFKSHIPHISASLLNFYKKDSSKNPFYSTHLPLFTGWVRNTRGTGWIQMASARHILLWVPAHVVFYLCVQFPHARSPPQRSQAHVMSSDVREGGSSHVCKLNSILVSDITFE